MLRDPKIMHFMVKFPKLVQNISLSYTLISTVSKFDRYNIVITKWNFSGSSDMALAPYISK